MGTIKLELDLPDFKDELSINIQIKRDGEVLVNKTETPSPVSKINTTKKKEKKISDTPKKDNTSLGGNLMGMTDF